MKNTFGDKTLAWRRGGPTSTPVPTSPLIGDPGRGLTVKQKIGPSSFAPTNLGNRIVGGRKYGPSIIIGDFNGGPRKLLSKQKKTI